MTAKKVSDIEEDYNPDMLPIEKTIIILVFLVAVFFIMVLLFGR